MVHMHDVHESAELRDQGMATEPKRQRSFLAAGLAVLLAAGAFFSGLQLGHSVDDVKMEAGLWSLFASAPVQPDAVDMTEFWRVWDLLDEKFVTSTTSESLTDQEKIQGAIDGLVASYGDPYTVYLPPADADKFEEEISGNFGGVGMEVGVRDGMITVVAPLPDTPAQRAGLVSGDVLVKIDGESTERMNIDEAVNRIRGEVGTEVVLTIYRKGEDDFQDITVVRDTITIPTIETKEVDGTFVISLFNFNALSEMKMQEALREYVKSGDRKLVLDLRGNPGGYLQSAVAIASYFLPAGKIVVQEGYGDDTTGDVYRSSGKNLREYAPEEMVVLVDEGSASAAEILSGALKEHGVATVIGDTTYGKGSVQELVDLPSGAFLKVTIARWYTPNGVSISDGGLDPDIFVERTPQQVVAGEDPQLDAALRWLSGDKNIGTTTKPVTD